MCESVKNIKCMCQSVNKGNGVVVYDLKNKLDEVSRYQCGHYISSSDTAWRILWIPVHESFSSVIPQTVGLENMQKAYFFEVKFKVQNMPKTIHFVGLF